MESSFGGPLVWYFNEVWGADAQFFGEVRYGPWYVILTYILGLVLCLGLALYPVWRRYWRRASQSSLLKLRERDDNPST